MRQLRRTPSGNCRYGDLRNSVDHFILLLEVPNSVEFNHMKVFVELRYEISVPNRTKLCMLTAWLFDLAAGSRPYATIRSSMNSALKMRTWRCEMWSISCAKTSSLNVKICLSSVIPCTFYCSVMFRIRSQFTSFWQSTRCPCAHQRCRLGAGRRHRIPTSWQGLDCIYFDASRWMRRETDSQYSNCYAVWIWRLVLFWFTLWQQKIILGE